MGYTKAQGPRAAVGVDLVGDTVQVGLTVGRLEASLAFYRNLLGLELLTTSQVPGAGTITQIGRGPVRLNLFSGGDHRPAPNHPGGVGPAPQGGWMPGGQFGIRWFTFKVDDLAGIMSRAAALGYEVAVPLIEASPNSKFAILRDPDGNSVEFVEYVDVTAYEERGQDQ